MLTENNLISGEIDASDDMEGMDSMIKACWNAVAKNRMKAIRLYAEGKPNDTIEIEAIANNMSGQLNKLIKDFMQYKKYTDLLAKRKPGRLAKMTSSDELKKQASSNGSIVQEVPKS